MLSHAIISAFPADAGPRTNFGAYSIAFYLHATLGSRSGHASLLQFHL